jgi:hypothetical protein
MPEQDCSKTGHGHWSAVYDDDDEDDDDVCSDVAYEFGHRLLIVESLV